MKNPYPSQHFQQTTAHLFRECSGKMVAILSKQFGLLQLENIMDVVQESFEAALQHWRYKGLPQQPESWLLKVAKNKMLNHLKRESLFAKMLNELPDDYCTAEPRPQQVIDSQLELLLNICQLKLGAKNQIIFTLYVLCGFGVPEIANALLMGNEAIKKSIFRTKQLLQSRNLSFKASPRHIVPYLDHIHIILYLMFNEGYKTTRDKQGLNIDLCYEAIRLTKLILGEIPNDGNTNALMALMFFNVARFPARLSSGHIWINLEEQNRSLWDNRYINEGFHYLRASRNTTKLSRYHLEATIASLHSTAHSFEATDWLKISDLYQQLEMITGKSFPLSVNIIIAQSHSAPSLALVKQLDILEHNMAPENCFLYYLAKAYLYGRLQQVELSQSNYQLALKHAQSAIDRQYILQKLGNDLGKLV